MDTSITYIEMCEAAEAVQNMKHNQQITSGDFWTYRDQERAGKVIKAKEDVYVRLPNCSSLYPFGHGIDHNWSYTFNKEEMIWLPKQDQIQAMVKTKDGETWPIYYLFHEMFEWLPKNGTVAEGKGDFPADSGEKIWLAYFMFRKYKQIWNQETKTWIAKG